MFNLHRKRTIESQSHPFQLGMRQQPSFVSSKQNKGFRNVFSQFTSPQKLGAIAQKSVGNLNKTLGNVQQVAKVVQSATPIIQEYGPLVKNLPAMYRMMKAINQIEDDDKELTKIDSKNNISKESV